MTERNLIFYFYLNFMQLTGMGTRVYICIVIIKKKTQRIEDSSFILIKMLLSE